MDTPERTDIKFTDPDFDKVITYFGNLGNKLRTITHGQLEKSFGKTALLNPSDLQVTAGMGVGTPVVTIESWHETTGEQPGRLQYHSFTGHLELHGEDGVINIDDDKYTLTTREYELLRTVAYLALAKSMTNDL